MQKIVLFDPSYGTSNLGDLIINEAVMKQMYFLFSKNYLFRYSTHSPLMHLHQVLKKNFISINCEPKNLKFLGGSNIFKHNMFRYTLDWNINIFTKGLYRNSVSIGGGCEGDPVSTNWYTKHIYRSVLSKDFVHSTRDNKTKIFLESLGLKAVNTGCPTMWGLTDAHCKLIPAKKSKNVVFTLTDYTKNIKKDQQLIRTLIKNYNVVYFWPQGAEDLEYFNLFSSIKRVKLVNPNLKSYEDVLNHGHVDYVGTRLHAGIYAMQHKVRSIILAVDNRARDIQEDYSLNLIERDDIDQLEKTINSDFVTDIRINEKRINLWKKQFEKEDL